MSRLTAVLALTSVCYFANAAQSSTPNAPTVPAAAATQKAMTKQQAKELFHSVDEILSFVSSDTKLPIEHTVKRKLISRDQVNRYLKEKFDEDEGAKRMERSEVVLKKFGLLDRDFHLRTFLLSLLTEQIAGFYDNKTKTVNLLDWIEPEEQKPVLAHELTHALQDQKIDLTKWSDVSLPDTSHNVQEDNHHLQVDEADTARTAVAEGQAMAVFIDYTLRSSGKTIADAPDLANRLKDQATDTSGSPVMARAPLLLQESLLFPYSEGLSFEQAILVKAGKEAAFSGVLANPPTSTFEIMHPEAYIAHAPVPVIRLPDIHPLLDPEYTPYDIGVMGELDVRILAELFGGREQATALAPEWNGGVYYAAQRKSAVTEAEKESTASIGLLYYSRWKNVDSARSFLRIYAAQIPRKYSNVVERKKDETDESELIYSTNEGDVLISRSGDSVFIGEGFNLSLARKLRDTIASVQPEGPMQQAISPVTEPTLSMSRVLASFGDISKNSLQRYTSRGAK
ncbi:hypothetical protein [Granulicella sp. S190]|uniref:hypothetical protein n=1 Tax=Granulicella sp. S190 TaxID=1747226 RepID=UPI001C207E79|nr:hypothetical protein [Granulicella sp. S190]